MKYINKNLNIRWQRQSCGFFGLIFLVVLATSTSFFQINAISDATAEVAIPQATNEFWKTVNACCTAAGAETLLRACCENNPQDFRKTCEVLQEKTEVLGGTLTSLYHDFMQIPSMRAVANDKVSLNKYFQSFLKSVLQGLEAIN
jgi:hypothetical protein